MGPYTDEVSFDIKGTFGKDFGKDAITNVKVKISVDYMDGTHENIPCNVVLKVNILEDSTPESRDKALPVSKGLQTISFLFPGIGTLLALDCFIFKGTKNRGKAYAKATVLEILAEFAVLIIIAILCRAFLK